MASTGIERTAGRGRWLALAAGVALLSGVFGTLELMWGRFLIGFGALLLSVVALRWPVSIWRVAPDEQLSARQRRIGLFAVCVVAVFFRTYHLVTPGVWGDDAINALLAFDVLDGRITSPFQLVTHANSSFHALTNYAIAAAFRLLGPGVGSLRVPGIVANVLTVPLFYGTIVPLFGARVALLAALFFACSPVQISHSKILLQVGFGEFFQLFGLCLLVRGVTGKRRWLIAAAGAPLALSLCTYHSAKLAPLVAVFYASAALWKAPPSQRRTLARAYGVGVVVLILCAVPGVLGYVRNPDALTSRIGGTALWPAIRATGSLMPLWNAVWRTLMIFHYRQGPEYHWLGPGNDPAFNVVVGFLLFHGLVQSLWRWKQARYLLLLAWVAVGLLPGCLSTEAPRVYRVLLATPPLYVWAALPVLRMYRTFIGAGIARRWVHAVVGVLVLSVPLIDFNYYFYRVETNADYRWQQAQRMVQMGRTLKALGPGWTGLVLSDMFNAQHETLRFLSRAWRLTIRDVTSLADVLPVRDAPQGGVLFMMDRGGIGAGALMRALYPQVQLDVRTDPPPRAWWFDSVLPLVTPPARLSETGAFFAASAETAAAIRGVTVSFFAADDTQLDSRVQTQLRLDAAPPLPNAARAVQVRWSGALYAPVDGSYEFTIESAGQAGLWIDEAQVLSAARPRAMRALAEGLHTLRGEAAVVGMPILRLQWKPPGEEVAEIPPTRLFRDARVHGLLAEYTIQARTVRRVEPYPYYNFFPETFAEPFAVRWSGRLQVPEPGGYRFYAAFKGAGTVTIDGVPWRSESRLPAGVHELEISISQERGAAHLELFWDSGNGARDLIPPEAFTPALEADRVETTGSSG